MLRIRKRIYDYAYCLTPRYVDQEKHVALSLFIFKRISMEWRDVPAAAKELYHLINLFEAWGKAKQNGDGAQEDELANQIEMFEIPEDCRFYGEMIYRIASFSPVSKAVSVLKNGWLAIAAQSPNFINKAFYCMSTYNNASSEHLLELIEHYKEYVGNKKLKSIENYEKLYLASGVANYIHYRFLITLLAKILKENPLYAKDVVVLTLDFLLERKECFKSMDMPAEKDIEKLPPIRVLYKWHHKLLALSTCFVWPIINMLCCFDIYEACAYVQMSEDIYSSIKDKIEQGINWVQYVSENTFSPREQAASYS